MTITINALPKQGITALSTTQRLRSKLVTLDLTTSEGAKAGIADLDGVKDLARDLFHQLHQADPREVDPPPAARAVNKQIFDFAKGNTYWSQTRSSTVGNILTAMHSATLLHDTLLKDEKFQEAMKQQEKTSELDQGAREKQALADALNQAAQGMPEGEAKQQTQAKADEAQAEANAQQQAAEQAQAHAQQIVAKQLGNGNTKTAARIGAALKQAAQESAEIAEGISGWGSEKGNDIREDPKAALEYLQRINRDSNLAQIAKLAGRFKGIAMSARASRIAVGNTPFDATFTRDIGRVFASELALLSPNAPEWVRAKQAAKYADNGLLGLDTRGEAKESGPFINVIDVSGSMRGERFVIAKAVGLGIAQVARGEDRHYLLSTFGSDHDPSFAVNSNESWQKHLEWAAYNRGGGTSFDKALRLIMELLLQFKQTFGEAIGEADAMITSDGEARVSKDVADEWRVFAEENGTRLLYVQVSPYSYDGDGVSTFGLPQIADKTIAVDRLDRITGDELAEQIGVWIQ